MNFSGSYASEDVTFLLKPVDLAATDVAAKERAIQSGTRHYSEMIAPEHVPDPAYLALYDAALARNGARLAQDIASLAAHLAARREKVVIASLARAGTPIGVLLLRALKAMGVYAHHYAISIIRDRGIDAVALAHIAARHDPADIVFVDGWTGKGAIATELRRSVPGATLAVVADPAGVADIAATDDDYLIASGLLNGIVSGLVSRSILSAETVGPGDFHACVTYPQHAPHDRSRAFIDTLTPLVLAARPMDIAGHAARTPALAASREALVADMLALVGSTDRNRIKPGIAEATRALLRRVPDRVLVRDRADPDVAHLLHLADTAAVPVGTLPSDCRYRAVAIIASLGRDQ
jgi:hypothetical protein